MTSVDTPVTPDSPSQQSCSRPGGQCVYRWLPARGQTTGTGECYNTEDGVNHRGTTAGYHGLVGICIFIRF